MTLLDAILTDIDASNAADPTAIAFEGTVHPQAWIEGRRAHHWAVALAAVASHPLQLAARAHHLRRWELPRESYPRTRAGYHEWRSRLYDFHAEALADLMRAHGCAEADCAAAGTLLHKRGIKTNEEAQTYEDAVSLAFVEVRLPSFASTVSQAQLANALRRTWQKMSPLGREAALGLDLPPASRAAVEHALKKS